MDVGFDDQFHQGVLINGADALGGVGRDVRVDQVAHVLFKGLQVQLLAGTLFDGVADFGVRVCFFVQGRDVLGAVSGLFQILLQFGKGAQEFGGGLVEGDTQWFSLGQGLGII